MWPFEQEDPSSLTWHDHHLGPLSKSESVVPIVTVYKRFTKTSWLAHPLSEDTSASQ